ncbi:glycosyltransferase family 2 protein [Algibacillus agarilyticus]|uniref:glycosyltransferase family 2 protein n=1 Tax=Algibacillus agarilyticus TaxID=2234133 RepID=UPI000DD00A3E|nr:glycosyltransferase [Algibacillus agarilyticus]
MVPFEIVIPVRNGGSLLADLLLTIEAEGYKDNTLIIDSESTDGVLCKFIEKGFHVHEILAKEFNHGGTRNLGVQLIKNKAKYVVFLTQDALVKPGSLDEIYHYIVNNELSAVCGRQKPHSNANPLASHARIFNYPIKSSIKSNNDISKYGIKSVFMSNSFAIYNIKDLEGVGLFPNNTILCEDMYAVAKMLKAGYKVGYCGEAAVRHSHNYSAKEEFKRYFDIGVFHAMEPWIQNEYGGAGGEGGRYLKSEFSYLWKGHKKWLPNFLINNLAKIVGMKLGKHYKKLPSSWIKKFSMHKGFWK